MFCILNFSLKNRLYYVAFIFIWIFGISIQGLFIKMAQ